MEPNFKQSLAWVRVSETGHTDSETNNTAHWGNGDDPDDSGGRTSRGITQREYIAYCEIAGIKGNMDVYEAPNPVVDDIYHKSYWNPWGPVMPPGVDYMLFDDSVLSGPEQAIRIMQQGLIGLGFNLGPTKDDGHIGMLTSAALIKAKPVDLIGSMAARRYARYEAIVRAAPKDLKFERGWDNRIVFAKANALTLVPKNDTAGA
jgi:lysozyme family protein